MARPRDADGGNCLQIWRAVVNILNKQSRTARSDGPPAWGLGEGLTTPQHKKQLVTKCYAEPRIQRVLVNTVMNLRVSLRAVNFLISWPTTDWS